MLHSGDAGVWLVSNEHTWALAAASLHPLSAAMPTCDARPQVYILPTIRINNGQYRGKLSYTEVLRAICAGFTKNAEPKVCMRVSVDDSCRDGSLGQTTCALRSGA